MRSAAVVIVLGAATPVAADPADLAVKTTPAQPEGAWDIGVGAAIDGGYATDHETSGEAGGGVVLGYQLSGSDSLGGCKTMELTQDAYGYHRGTEDGVSLDGGAEVCIDQVDSPDGMPGKLVQFPRITGGYDLRTQTRPRYDAPGTLRADEYSLYTVHFDFGAYEKRDAKRRFTAARMSTRADVTLQGKEATVHEPSQSLLSIDFGGFSAELDRDSDHPLVIRAADVAWRYEGNYKTSLLAVTPFGFSGWQRGALRLGADAGYTYGHALHRHMHIAIGGASVETEVGDLALGVRARRDVLPAVDPIVIVDDRVTVDARYPLLGGALSAAGFAATSLAVSVQTGTLDRREFTGGGALAFRRALGRYMMWNTAVELGRSFYPRFDGSAPEIGTVARATTRLEARVGTGWKSPWLAVAR